MSTSFESTIFRFEKGPDGYFQMLQAVGLVEKDGAEVIVLIEGSKAFETIAPTDTKKARDIAESSLKKLSDGSYGLLETNPTATYRKVKTLSIFFGAELKSLHQEIKHIHKLVTDHFPNKEKTTFFDWL